MGLATRTLLRHGVGVKGAVYAKWDERWGIEGGTSNAKDFLRHHLDDIRSDAEHGRRCRECGAEKGLHASDCSLGGDSASRFEEAWAALGMQPDGTRAHLQKHWSACHPGGTTIQAATYIASFSSNMDLVTAYVTYVNSLDETNLTMVTQAFAVKWPGEVLVSMTIPPEGMLNEWVETRADSADRFLWVQSSWDMSGSSS